MSPPSIKFYICSSHIFVAKQCQNVRCLLCQQNIECHRLAHDRTKHLCTQLREQFYAGVQCVIVGRLGDFSVMICCHCAHSICLAMVQKFFFCSFAFCCQNNSKISSQILLMTLIYLRWFYGFGSILFQNRKRIRFASEM